MYTSSNPKNCFKNNIVIPPKSGYPGVKYIYCSYIGSKFYNEVQKNNKHLNDKNFTKSVKDWLFGAM